MPADISRTSDEQRYSGVVMQQGRVILDRDFNALRQTIDRRIDADALDFVGPCGTPDNGFAIGPITAGASPPPPPLWIPPAPSSPPHSNGADFSISGGTMYVGGQRAVFPPIVPGQGNVEYSYFNQPDWISPPQPTSLAQEFVYLHLLEHEVSVVEDPELKDVALGGPDTTQRLHLVKRVKRLPVTSTDCIQARTQAMTDWAQKGLSFDPQTMRLIPQATLLVTYTDPTTQSTPCDPVAQGGYLGAENQLFRVQISDGGVLGGAAQLIWGIDNASSLYRATPVPGNNTSLSLGQSPVDSYHIPQNNQVVEILHSAMIIDTENDGTVRCVAEARGFVCTAASFSANPPILTLNQSLPTEYQDDPNPIFVRIWQTQTIKFTPDGSTQYPLQYADGSQTGVQVQIGPPTPGGPIQPAPIGAYWMFAVRPSTPQAVYPERFLAAPQPPDGPRQWACPLAIIDWTEEAITSPPASPIATSPVIYDCRQSFDNLVSLSNRFTAEVIAKRDSGGKIFVQNGGILTSTELANGLAICLNLDIDPASVTPGACFLSMELPFNSTNNVTVGFTPTVIAAVVSAAVASPSTSTGPSGAGTITWSPTTSAQQYITGQLPLVAPNFTADWNVYPPSTPAATWAYAGSVSQAIGVGTDANAFAGVLAVSTQPLGFGAQSLAVSVFGPGPGQPLNNAAATSVGLVFNFINTSNFNQTNDFWVAAILFDTSGNVTVQVTHYVNGLAKSTVSAQQGIPSDPASTYDLSVATVVSSGQTTLVATAAGRSNPSATSSVTIPTSLAAGWGVGLLTNYQGTTTFSQLTVTNSDGSETLLPPQPAILSRLTVKRDLLRLAGASATNNTLPSPRPDFSMWFWVQPGEARFDESRWDQCVYV